MRQNNSISYSLKVSRLEETNLEMTKEIPVSQLMCSVGSWPGFWNIKRTLVKKLQNLDEVCSLVNSIVPMPIS